MIRENSEAWRSFFGLKEAYHDPDSDVTERPSPPGFRGNQDEGRELRTVIRKDAYSMEWGERSRLEILIGDDLKKKYGYSARERLRLEVCGVPNWPDYDSQAASTCGTTRLPARSGLHNP